MKEFSELRQQLQGSLEDLEELNEAMATGLPPNILILRRKTIRAFPDNTYVALYYNDQLDKYFSVPYGAHVDAPVTGTNLAELHAPTLKRYISKASKDIRDQGNAIYYDNQAMDVSTSWMRKEIQKDIDKAKHKQNTRIKGIDRAVNKLGEDFDNQIAMVRDSLRDDLKPAFDTMLENDPEKAFNFVQESYATLTDE